jgi:ABC-type transporter Mla subunit MlaD
VLWITKPPARWLPAATRRRSGAARGTPDALGRLNGSIEAAQAALKDLRSEMSRGSRELLKDLDKTLRDARKNLGRTRRRIAKDLDEVQQAARGKRTTTARRASSRGGTARRRSAGRSAGARK